MQTLVATTAVPAGMLCRTGFTDEHGFGRLMADPDGLLDLPSGFSYSIVARHGEEMDDGLLIPGFPDGMAVFDGGDGTVKIICNHEISPIRQSYSAFGEKS